MEFTRNNENREFHNKHMRNQAITPEDLDGATGFGPDEADNETDLYPNTITGNRVSAADRPESFDHPDYGATGQRTRKDIIRESEDNENQ